MRTPLFLFGSAVLAFAMSAPPGYVQGLKNYLASKEFSINGLFYMYDFNHNGKIERNDWLYITNDSNHRAYQLMGKPPTATDAFGWLPLSSIPADLDRNKPSGYFVFINFPKDKEFYGTNAFSWVYVSSGKTYKLMGADANHNFDYLDENGDGQADPLSNVSYTTDGKVITFIYATQDQKISCEDEQSFSQQGISFYMKIRSWFIGNIIYNCKYNSEKHWDLKPATITIKNIQKSEQFDITLDSDKTKGISIYDYAKGEVHIQGTYNGQKIDCYEYYRSIVPVTVSRDNITQLEKIMENWGSGPCDPDFIRTTCPHNYYQSFGSNDCSNHDNSKFTTANFIDAHIITDWEVTESSGKGDKVHKDEVYKKQ